MTTANAGTYASFFILATLATRSILLTQPAQASVKSSDPQIQSEVSAVRPISVVDTRAALRGSPSQVLAALLRQGPNGYKNLIQIAFDPENAMGVRWKSVLLMARLGGELSIPELERAAQDSSWFMRNAGLLGLEKVDKIKAVFWSRKLLDDPALVVRTSAVRTLARLQDHDSAELMWNKIYSAENFRSGQSLWIRQVMLDTLSQFSRKQDIGRFVEVLSDADSSLHSSAIKALEKMTRKKFGQFHEPASFKAIYWKNWWERNRRKPVAQAKIKIKSA